MSSKSKVNKVQTEKTFTRAKAEKLLTSGVDPEQFTKHANYHVRRRAWQLQGRPLSADVDEQNKFLATLQGMPAPKDPSVLPGFYALVRQRILKEVPVVETLSTEE